MTKELLLNNLEFQNTSRELHWHQFVTSKPDWKKADDTDKVLKQKLLSLEIPENCQYGIQQHNLRFTSTVTLHNQGTLDQSLGRLQEVVEDKIAGTPFKLQKMTDSELRVESVIVQAFQVMWIMN